MVKFNRRLLAFLVITVFVLSTFSVISTLSRGEEYNSVPQISINGFSFEGNMNSNATVTGTIIIPFQNISLLYFYTQEISDPYSPMYHHFLNSKELVDLFSNIQEYNTVVKYLNQNNIKVEYSSLDSVITFVATVKQIREFLGMNVCIYSNGKESYYYAYGTPSLPNIYIYSSDMTKLMFSKPSTFISYQDVKSMEKRFRQINPVFSIEPYYTTWLQNVYNATGLYSMNIMGQGQTIGILDFGGDPYIQEELDSYDSFYGLPNVNVSVVPIGPYNPMMGIATGWNGEIAMDVESSHTMAPYANITLYIGNMDYSLAQVIAYIVSQDKVNDLSQSFSMTESFFANFPAIATYANMIIPDYLYLLGSLEGITFIASTGDAGGSGYSAGPLGTLGYPATSPFVTAMGGTTTYITINNYFNATSWYQTAWSNYGFVPPYQNYGGGTGGISMFEPLPWYQKSFMVNAKGYPNGRMNPDISLESAVFPGMVYMFWYNSEIFPGISGGTSEASPLFAGLVVLLDQYLGTHAGLVNPALYTIAQNKTMYAKAFNQITFGYNIPWVCGNGYNLVTGLGSVNIGALSFYMKNLGKVSNSLSIVVNTTNPFNTEPSEFPDGYLINITANINENGVLIKNGSFIATLNALQGNANAEMKFNSKTGLWSGNITVPENYQGIAFLYVSGNASNGASGYGYYELFLGYYAYYNNTSLSSYLLNNGVKFKGNISLINGGKVNATFNVTIDSYSILNNTYYQTIEPLQVKSIKGKFSFDISSSIPPGVSLLITNGAYGYLPFYSGPNLQYSLILGPVLGQPGAVAAGSDILVSGIVLPPENINNNFTELNITVGSTITFYLVNQAGNILSNVSLPYNTTGLLYVPKNIPSGLYDVIIKSSYDSYSLNTYINGSFFGQIWVSPLQSNPKVSVTPSELYEGQYVYITASIIGQNSMPIKYGMYSATVFPESLNYTFNVLTNYENIPLYYDTDLNMWIYPAQMPSESSSNVLSSILNGPYYWPGEYDVFVAGISATGIPTNTLNYDEASITLLQGPELVITLPVNGNVPYTTNGNITIAGYTTATSLAINGKSVGISNGYFSVNENLVQGLNTFNVVAMDSDGYQSSQLVTVLYLPQISSIEQQLGSINNQINNINNEISSHSSQISSLKGNISSLENQLNNISVEIKIIQSSFGINLQNLINEINALQSKLQNTSENLNTVKSSSSSSIENATNIAEISLILAIVSIIISAIFVLRVRK